MFRFLKKAASQESTSGLFSLSFAGRHTMKILVKTLERTQFDVEVADSDTIADVKKKIEATQSHPATSQRLLFRGKILEDDQKLLQNDVKEGDFLVLMVKKVFFHSISHSLLFNL